MNLLGMKRKLLPYGMALGGGGALGGMSAASPSSGGKSAPPTQNNYSPSFGSQSAAPTSAAPSGGKSAPPTQNNYGPSFGGGMPISGTGGELFGASPISSVNSTTQQDMMGRSGTGQSFGQTMQGGKSSGLGQGGYGGAPSFDGMPTQGGFNQGFNQAANPNMGSGLRGFNGTFSPEALAFQQANPQPQQPTSQMEDMVRMMSTGSDRGTDPAVADQMRNQLSGMRENLMRNLPQQMSSDQFRQSGGFNQPSQFGGFNQPSQGNFGFLDMTQDAQRQRQMGGMGGMGGMGAAATQRQMQGGFGPQAPTQDSFNAFRAMTGSPMNFDQFAQSRGNKFTQQPQQQFGGFQQQRQFQQPQISGLQSLFNNMMGQFQQQQRPQQMPRFQSQALQYRPDMTQAQAALSRVKPSVQKQEQDAQTARIAELEAQLAGYQTPTTSSFDGGGG